MTVRGKPSAERKLGIYIHIPFCVRKCAYCDFLSAPAAPLLRERYVQALCSQIRTDAGKLDAKYIPDTLFFGGGTPSILEAEQIGRILHTVREAFPSAAFREVTLECNPGTLREEVFPELLRLGINRLSIGLQSANASELQCLGRIHTYEEFLHGYKAARRAGFMNISVDLMSAIPGQTQASLRETLGKVLALEPEHLSLYSLILEEGTRLFEQVRRGEITVPDADEAAFFDGIIHEEMRNAGYERYEISNYAKPGFMSLHNLKYWIGGEYLGFGSGAASMMLEDCGLFPTGGVSGKDENGFSGVPLRIRFNRSEGLPEYMPSEGSDEGGKWFLPEEPVNYERLGAKEQMEEFLFLGLRTVKGVREAEFAERFGLDIRKVYGSVIGRYTDLGFLKSREGFLYLTEEGLEVSNVILADFLLDTAAEIH